MGSGESKLDDGMHGFTKEERGLLDQIFKQMAVRDGDKSKISKEIFLEFFELPGLLSERLFEVFDTNQDGEVDIDEFIRGYHIFAKGSTEEKVELLFDLICLDGGVSITKEDLSTVLMSIVTPPHQMFDQRRLSGIAEEPRESRERQVSQDTKDAESRGISKSTGFRQVQNRVDTICEQAFTQCDINHDGRLTLDEFTLFLEANSDLIHTLDELFVLMSWDLPLAFHSQDSSSAGLASASKSRLSFFSADASPIFETIMRCDHCRLKFTSDKELASKSKEEIIRHTSSLINIEADGKTDTEDYEWVLISFLAEGGKNDTLAKCPKCGRNLIKEAVDSVDAGSLTKSSVLSKAMEEEHFEGPILIQRGRFSRYRERYAVIHGKFLYIYKTKSSKFPETALFIQGYYAKQNKNVAQCPSAPFIITLTPPEDSDSKEMKFNVKSEELAVQWVNVVSKAANTQSITRYYELKETLGKGTFATVWRGVPLHSSDSASAESDESKDVAVKVISKDKLEGEQKDFLRVEIGIMKLVKHPRVIQLTDMFETQRHVYLVMPLLPYGSLFDYMKNNRKDGLSESEAQLLLWNLLDALKYLHKMGIVHRDLKPENLLVKYKDTPCDIVITDFGLSKFAKPQESMRVTCGTLTYVAPEVLRMSGYGKEVDIWSCGIILYAVLRVKLPFYSDQKSEIISLILRTEVNVYTENWKPFSDEVKDLIQNMLKKDPRKRISIDEILHKHPWLAALRRSKSVSIAVDSDEKADFIVSPPVSIRAMTSDIFTDDTVVRDESIVE